MKTVNIVRSGSQLLSRAKFETLKKGDTFFVRSLPHVVRDDVAIGESAPAVVYDMEGACWSLANLD